MQVEVEFFGIPRQRAGQDRCLVEVDRPTPRLRDVLRQLAHRFPRLVADCLEDERLQPSCLANLNGERFVLSPDTALQAGDVVLIMSADAGG